MGKPKNQFGRKVTVVAQTADLDTFNAQEEASQKKTTQPQQKAASTLTKAQQDFSRACEQVIEGDLPIFYYLDNKVIEAYYHRDSEHALNKKELQETLDQDIFLFNIRSIVSELNCVLDLPFANFWAQLTQSNKVINFLDTLLQNIRKVNDTYKLQVMALEQQPIQSNSMSMMMMQQANPDEDVKEHVDILLSTVFAFFCRLSLSVESEECYFPIAQYQQLILDNGLFDIAKLYDIAAIFGPTNPEAVTKLIGNVFENDPRQVQDFKESIDTMITCLKKCFNSALKVTEMSSGDSILNRTQAEEDDIIKRLLLNFAEILIHLELSTRYFPESMLETVRNTSLPLFMGNVYSLMIGPVKKIWLKKSQNNRELDIIRRSLKKLAVESCITILDVAIVRHVGVHVKNYAVLQNILGQNLKQFIFGVTGNIELSKESLHKNQNYLVENSAGQKFLQKILNHQISPGNYSVDIVTAIQSLDDRFLDQHEKQFLLMILKSLSQGLKVNVHKKLTQKILPPAQTQTKLQMEDRENIKSICDMFSGQFSKQKVEEIYIDNGKNMEKTLDLFLSNKVSKENEEIVVEIVKPKVAQIDTRENNAKLHEYVMNEYKDILFPKEQSKFAKQANIDHQKALSLMEEDQTEDDKRVRAKILMLAEMMEYDDDIEESKVQQIITQQAKKETQIPRKSVEQQGEDDDDDEDDPEFFIERQASNTENDTGYMFTDDQKQRKPIQKHAEEQKVTQDQKKNQPKQDNKKNQKETQESKPNSIRDGQREAHKQEQRPQTGLKPEQNKYVVKGEKKDEVQNNEDTKFDNAYKSTRGGRGAPTYVQREDGIDRPSRGRGEGNGYRGQDNKKIRGGGDQQRPSNRGGYSGNRGGNEDNRDVYVSRGGHDHKPDKQQTTNQEQQEQREERPQYSGNRGGYDRPSTGNSGGDRGGYDRPSQGNRGGDRGGYDRPSTGNRGGDRGGYDRPSQGNRGGDRGAQRGARGQLASSRGGYREDYQRESIDKDHDYTTKNPLEQQAESDNEEGGGYDQEANGGEGRSGTGIRGTANRGRGRGVQNRRGGAHNQKNKADKKYASNF